MTRRSTSLLTGLAEKFGQGAERLKGHAYHPS